MKFHFNTIFEKEGEYFIAKCLELGVVSQGKTIEEAQKNLKEAVDLYLEDVPVATRNELTTKHPLITSFDLEYA
ncbi:MAG: type II toxin-antitoxin system HicB family antitoxin [Candidatus Magasanikbacteria bacterium]|nr:type II toxin-antitoxin system HicB family antitoxin [Candidatus Magasanikbacteria bacterium]